MCSWVLNSSQPASTAVRRAGSSRSAGRRLAARARWARSRRKASWNASITVRSKWLVAARHGVLPSPAGHRTAVAPRLCGHGGIARAHPHRLGGAFARVAGRMTQMDHAPRTATDHGVAGLRCPATELSTAPTASSLARSADWAPDRDRGLDPARWALRPRSPAGLAAGAAAGRHDGPVLGQHGPVEPFATASRQCSTRPMRVGPANASLSTTSQPRSDDDSPRWSEMTEWLAAPLRPGEPSGMPVMNWRISSSGRVHRITGAVVQTAAGEQP
jgi:hypothetical protein